MLRIKKLSLMSRLFFTIPLILIFNFTLSFSQNLLLDKDLGDKAAREVEMSMGVITSTPSADFVTAVGSNIIQHVRQPFQFNFKLIDSEIPNAFALPGGHIYITRGLLALVNTEDELASVIGHEIVHVLERHAVEQMKKTVFPSLLQVPGKLIGNIFNEDMGDMINAPVVLTSKLYLSSYSRGQESEADRIGIEMAANAGYDPFALADILTSITRAVEIYTREKEKKSYFDDHPFTPKRVERINKKSQGLTIKERESIVSSKTALYEILQGLIFGENPAQGIFRDSEFFHPELDFYLVFPKEWKSTNTPTAVAAFDEDNKALILLSVMDTIMDTQVIANLVAEKINKEKKLSPVESKSIFLAGNPASYLVYKDPSYEDVNFVLAAWIQYGQLIYQLIGLGSMNNEENFRSSIFSFRKLTEDEKRSISVLKIYVAKANQGESLRDFCERTVNEWNPRFTAIANGISENSVLKEGQLLKIVRKELYSLK